MRRRSLGNSVPVAINRYINSAYDNVLLVAENIEAVKKLSEDFEYLSFYLGAYSTPPTERPNGEPLVTGDFYFNDGSLFYYDEDGNTWSEFDPDVLLKASADALDAAALATAQAERAEEARDVAVDAEEKAHTLVGGTDIGDYEDDPTFNNIIDYVVFGRGTSEIALFKVEENVDLPYTVDSVTNAHPTDDDNLRAYTSTATLYTYEETTYLTDGQVVVDTTSELKNYVVYLWDSASGDRERLDVVYDYTTNASNQIVLTDTYPVGSIVTIVFEDIGQSSDTYIKKQEAEQLYGDHTKQANRGSANAHPASSINQTNGLSVQHYIDNTGIQGEWISGTSYAYKDSEWWLDGVLYRALKDTSVDPVGDDVNWREVVSNRSLGGVTNYQTASVADMIGLNYLSVGDKVSTSANVNGEPVDSSWGIIQSQSGRYCISLNNGLYAELSSKDGDLRHYGLVNGGDIYSPLVAAISGGKKTIKIPKLRDEFTLSQNLVNSTDFIRLWFEQETEIKLIGGSFDQSLGAIELTGNHVKISGGLLITTDGAQEVTPLRVGNTAYGSGDVTRRKGIKIKSVRMVNTGYGNPNHGNFVIIGAIDPDLSFIRLEGTPTSAGNFEVLGVKGGSARDCFAENGTLGNFHATSADGVGFPCEDFTFERCEAIHSLSTVEGDNCYKISRNCKKVKAINCKGTSIANGAFTGNDHVFFLQGVQKCAFIDCDVFMQGNGQFKAPYGIHDHGESLTGASDNVISGGTVEINTPGLNNRIVLMFEAFNRPISRNSISNITLNVYNGSVDAFLEMSGTNSGLINDNTVKDCSGVGTPNAILARANVGVNWLSGNKLNGFIDQYITYSGEIKQILDVSEPNHSTATFSGSGTVNIGMPNKNRNSARITLPKNVTGGTVDIAGFALDPSVTINDGFQVTIVARADTSSINAVNLVQGGTGRFRLAGNVNFTFGAFSSITLQSMGADWVEVSRRS